MMFGHSDEEWRLYVADLRASYDEDFTAEEKRYWDEHRDVLCGRGQAALDARVAWFRQRRESRQHAE